jgi:pimeloyl-ACP methyl ester carboxylesterase
MGNAGLGLSVLIIVLVGLGAFLFWRRRLLAHLRRGSEMVETPHGPVEFARVGTGPVILQLHGGATGYDQTLALRWDAQEAGVTVLTPSRPGYLRTPLSTGATPEEAADAMSGLLDILGIEKVAVMGTSGGAPTALQFALRHRDRVWALVLQSAVSRRYVEPRRSTHSLLGRVVFSRSGQGLVDFAGWAFHVIARYWPSLLVRMFFNASEDPQLDKAKQRRAYVRRHPAQLAFFHALVASRLSLSARRAGLWNDLHQYADLPVYPLEQITCPTLVLHGRADGNVPFAHAEFIARTVPNADLLALEDCGHLIWVGPGAESAREKVLFFLRQHSGQ